LASSRAILRASKAAPGGARPTPAPQGPGIGQISPLAAQLANESGYSNSYGPFLPRPSRTFTEGAFGPFSPILPVPVDSPPPGAELPLPRRFDYPVGFNLPSEPGNDGFKLASFATLQSIASVYSVARTCIQRRKDEIAGLDWDIVPTHEASKAYQGDHGAMRDFGERRAKAVKFFKRPDPNYFGFDGYLKAVLDQVFAIDALSQLLRPKRAKGLGRGLCGSDLDCFELVDGATIRPLLDLRGGVPRPPAPAWQQYLKSVPRSDFTAMWNDQDIEEAGLRGMEASAFRNDQMLYLPTNPRPQTPYGFGATEQALIVIMTGLRKQAYQLEYYSEGTVPAVYISPGDVNITPNQVRELQDALNAYAGDQAWHHKIIVLPPGSRVDPQRPQDLADQFDEIIMTEVAMVYDVDPMSLGIIPKVSTVASPFAAREMAQASRTVHERTSTKPLLKFLCNIFNTVLHQVAGQDDMKFTFAGMDEAQDQAAQTDLLVKQVQNGIRSVDEAREELELTPWGLPETSGPVVFTQMGVVPFEWVPGSQLEESVDGGAYSGETSTAEDQGQQQVGGQGDTRPMGVHHPPSSRPVGTHNPRLGLPSSGTRLHAETPPERAGRSSQTPAHAAAQGAHGTTRQGKAADGGMEAFQDRGEPVRRRFGIDGTAGDAQDAPHPFTPDGGDERRCVACGLSPAATVHSGREKAAKAELEALARHLRKGRHITTWRADHIPGAVLAMVAEDLTKGLTVDEAVAGAMTVVLPKAAYEWADKAGPQGTSQQQSAQQAQQLARTYAQRIRAAFTAVAKAALRLIRMWLTGALAVTALALAGMIADLISRHLTPPLTALWREAWHLGSATAEAVVRDEEPDWEPGRTGTAATSAAMDAWVASHGRDVIEGITTTRIPGLADMLSQGAAAGETAEHMAAAIAVVLGFDQRADTIAVTETERGKNGGMTDAYRLAGVMQKFWKTREDAKVCGTCRANEAEGWIAFDAPFTSGNLSPGAHPNCRCRLLGRLAPAAAKKYARAVGINGQEYWPVDSYQHGTAPGMGGPMPTIHDADGIQTDIAGGVPGATAGGEPPRWGGSETEHLVTATSRSESEGRGNVQTLGGGTVGGPYEDRSSETHVSEPLDADDAEWPQHRGVPPRPGRDWPAPYMDGYWPVGGHGTGQAPGSPIVGGPRGRPPNAHGKTAKGAKGHDPGVAGLAVRAADTGRVLMLQRAWDEDDDAAGHWEFPGGHLEPGENAYEAARREWAEETGCEVPDGDLDGIWNSSDGHYRGFVLTIPSEDAVPAFGDRDAVTNPDDPDGDQIEALAWWHPGQLKDNPAVRSELLEDVKRVRRALKAAGAKSAETPTLEATPDILGPNGLWHTPDRHVGGKQKLPNYIEHIAHALMRDQGMDESRAIATAINAVKRWAAGDLHWGKGKVTPEVQAASRRALAEWEHLKETHH
jgi:8-oxo-dGTP pyrophosphatase MutT (NUDIX family)